METGFGGSVVGVRVGLRFFFLDELNFRRKETAVIDQAGACAGAIGTSAAAAAAAAAA